MLISKVEFRNGDKSLAYTYDGAPGSAILRPSNRHQTLADILFADDPVKLVESLSEPMATMVSLEDARTLAPIDQQEVWAAGVTYKRSQVARMEESETGASHYDRVYTAARPEIFFKATPHRVVGPGQPIRIRRDTNWSVPEPELALVISPRGKLVGYTIGNDMSARDIEGENPLYLPQAKVYSGCCGLGPAVLLATEPLDRAGTKISLEIVRKGGTVFSGATDVDQMARTFEDLIDWLFRDNTFPNGVILLTGTGVVPPNEFTLAHGDVVNISITGIGTLTNTVIQS